MYTNTYVYIYIYVYLFVPYVERVYIYICMYIYIYSIGRTRTLAQTRLRRQMGSQLHCPGGSMSLQQRTPRSGGVIKSTLQLHIKYRLQLPSTGTGILAWYLRECSRGYHGRLSCRQDPQAPDQTVLVDCAIWPGSQWRSCISIMAEYLNILRCREPFLNPTSMQYKRLLSFGVCCLGSVCHVCLARFGFALRKDPE